MFPATLPKVEKLVKGIDDKTWDGKIGHPLRPGRKGVPVRAAGRMVWFTLFDLIHHRGQLSTYIRPMGGKVPSIYGPSADDPGGCKSLSAAIPRRPVIGAALLSLVPENC